MKLITYCIKNDIVGIARVSKRKHIFKFFREQLKGNSTGKDWVGMYDVLTDPANGLHTACLMNHDGYELEDCVFQLHKNV